MTDADSRSAEQPAHSAIPWPALVVFRGIGQVFFQENALSGLLFAIGIALSSPTMAIGAVCGSAIGLGTARALKFDHGETLAGIYGFNATLVGIATFFFFPVGPVVIGLMFAGCVVATLLTRAFRLYAPFPTYTAPFIVTTWGVFFLAQALGSVPDPGAVPVAPNPQTGFHIEATAHGISQVMFQESIWTGLFFILGIALSDQRHALLVLAGAFVGMQVGVYHFTLGADAIDPERLITRGAFDLIRLGLFGFNATLAPIALYLWRKSLIAALLGMLLTVPLTEVFPMVGLPALTAPFVVATWLVMLIGWLEAQWHPAPAKLHP